MWSTQFLIVNYNVGTSIVTVDYTLTLMTALTDLLSAIGGIVALVYFTLGGLLYPLEKL